MNEIITRFPPSPTGYLHVGSLRTALYNFLFAQKNNGKFLLRIEDTDKTRLVPGSDQQIIDLLDKFKLKRDNQEVIYQSQRLDIYKQYAEQLIDSGQAYYCFCQESSLNKIREQQKRDEQPPGYWGPYRQCHNLSSEEAQKRVANNEPHVIRFKMLANNDKPQQKDELKQWTDEIHGNIAVSMEHQDDFVMIKSDGYPTYNFANVIDDHKMGITHVIRGEEFLSSTIKHIKLYKALGWPLPTFAHLPLLLNPDKSKLSKRQNDVAVEEYLKQGYLPAALINFIALLGWNPGSGSTEEFFNLPELTNDDFNFSQSQIKNLINEFSLDKINKSGAVFDLEKLDWLNGWYIRNLKFNKLVDLCKPYLSQIKDQKLLEKIVYIERERIKKLSDISQNIDFFYKEKIDYKPELLIWKKSNKKETLENLVKLEDFLITLKNHDFDKIENLETQITDWIKKNNYGVGDILWPMRVALSGQQNSPNPFEIAWALGKEKTLKRLNNAQNKLK
jgi:glutamyl-tRNA synthetase